MATYPLASFNFRDVTALADGEASLTLAKSFCDPELFQDHIYQTEYGTMEHNQFLLDGSRTILPDEDPEDVPYWSSGRSGEQGYFEGTAPGVTVQFSRPHSSIGLTLEFAIDIPEQIRVIWYTGYGTKLDEMIFYPDAQEYFCDHQVSNYQRVRIEAVKSSVPDRYFRLNHIEYGQIWKLGRDNIQKASVYEEIDLTSATLSINTADITVMDPEGKFDVINQDGLWRSLQKEQEIAITEYINGRQVDCGTFFLDEWECQNNAVSFKMIDRIGVMDKTKFYAGRIYENEEAGRIIEEIMASCGITAYTVATDVYSIRLSGWLGIQSHREALQQVVFACGAIADCSRGDQVRIYRPTQYVSQTIGIERKFQGTKVTLREYISAVAVTYEQYFPADQESQIVKRELNEGRIRIEFSSPYLPQTVNVTAGTIVTVSTNYVVIDMPATGECTVKGIKYETIQNTYTAEVDRIEAGENANVKTYQGCTLMDAARAKETAEKLLEFAKLRQEVEMRYINIGEAVGNWCDIGMISGGWAVTGLMSQTLDLTGGNIASAKGRGYRQSLTDYYFTGTELYAGEEGIA